MTRHGCTVPIEGKDIFYDKTYSQTLFDTVNSGEPVTVKRVNILTKAHDARGAIYRCMTCMDRGSKRAFELQGVKGHIQAK